MQGLRCSSAEGPRVLVRRLGHGQRGVTAVEFALVAPLAFLLLLGILVTGLVVTDEVALTNAVRSGARAAAVCGSDPGGSTVLPDGQTPCTSATGVDAGVDSYVTGLLRSVQAGVSAPTFSVVAPDGTTYSSLADCRKGYRVVVSASFAQPLYVPMLGHLLGDGGSNTRTLNAMAEATCEQ
jgi:Flp pilus assembly protein TadG